MFSIPKTSQKLNEDTTINGSRQSFEALNETEQSREIPPLSREIKVSFEGQEADKDLNKVTDNSAWEINISELSGRARKNKKRSG